MSTWLSRTELYLFNSGPMAEGDDQVQGHLMNLNVHGLWDLMGFTGPEGTGRRCG